MEKSYSVPAGMAAVVMSNNNISKPESHQIRSHDTTISITEKDKSTPLHSLRNWLLRSMKCKETEIQVLSVHQKMEPKEDDTRLPLVEGDEPQPKFNRQAIRSNYMDKSIEAKKKVIRMLFVVVAEFFVCWAPLHLLNTWYLFSPELVYRYIGSTGVSLVHLLAYISSCCNPITYCFMNHKFRIAFISLFQSRLCYVSGGRAGLGPRVDTAIGPGNSDLSGNESTLYAGRASRSEVVVLEKEERV